MYRLRAPRRDHSQQPHDQSQHESEATRHQVRTDEGGSVRAIWNCRARVGMHNMDRVCAHWNVYVGHKTKPKRIDLRCKKCGCRHQFRPERITRRGRKSRLRWIARAGAPLSVLEHEAQTRNGSMQTQLDDFETALERHARSSREKTRRHLEQVSGTGSMYVPSVGGKQEMPAEKPKLTWWRRLLGFFRTNS